MLESLNLWLQPDLSVGRVLFLALVVGCAGVVRGFSGFGSALVYIPLAGLVLPPVWVVITVLAFDALGPLPLLSASWRAAERRELGWLLLGTLCALPLGIYLLSQFSEAHFRYLVSSLSLLTLVLLVSGWRYRGALGRFSLLGVGAVSGIFGGAAGLPGPPVILCYMSGEKDPRKIRATIMLFLFFFDLLSVVMFSQAGLLQLTPILLGLFLALPYSLGCMLGARCFNPAKERMYRTIAYCVIALAAIGGLS